jgi:hypothetical protein
LRRAVLIRDAKRSDRASEAIAVIASEAKSNSNCVSTPVVRSVHRPPRPVRATRTPRSADTTLANKMARMMWAMLTKEEDYRNPAQAAAA